MTVVDEVSQGAWGRERLRQFLNGAPSFNSVPYTDHGFVNHTELARQLGLSQACVAKNQDLIREFEDRTADGYAQDRLTKLCGFIDQGFRDRTLHYANEKLDRQQAFEAIDVGRKAALSPRIEAALVGFDKRAREIGYTMKPGMPAVFLPPGSQRERIYLAVQNCIENGEPIWKHGRVVKSKIAERMGIDPANLSLHPEVFDHFNLLHGNWEKIEAELERRVDAAITASIEAREVDVVVGKLEHRAAIQSQIPEAFSTAERRARMTALFKRRDREALEAGYICVRKEKQLQRLSELLASGKFTRELYGTANLKALRKELSIPRFHQDALELIASFEKEKITRLKADPLCAEIEGRYFSFGAMCDLGYPESYVMSMATCFRKSYSELKGPEAGRYHLALMKLFIWLKHQDRVVAAVANNIHIKGAVKDVDWLYVLMRYKDSVDERSQPRLIAVVNNLSRNLAVAGLVPWLACGIPNGRRKAPTGTIKSFAEVAPTPVDGHESRVDGFMEFIENFTNSDNFSLFAEADRVDSKNFYAALKQDFLINGTEGPLEVVAATRFIIERRQELFNERFKTLIAEGVQTLEEGDRLASLGQDPDLYWHRLCDGELSQGEKSRLTREFFPNPDTEDRTALKNSLRLIRDKFKRKAPLEGEEGYWFFKRRYQEIAPSSEMQAYLLPTNALMLACASIYFQGSGVNLPVGRGLLEKCYQPSNDKNYRRVVGFKAKAKGKPIIYYFEVRSDECLALEVALKWGKYLRDVAPPEHEGLMFLQKVGPRIQPINQYGLRKFFEQQRSTIDGIEQVALTPQMWRPTLLLLAAIDNGGKLGVALALAQHTEGVSGHYYDRMPLRLMHEVRLRYFKELLEAAVIHAVPGSPAYIGLDPKTIHRRLADAIDVGIGIACADPYEHSAGQSVCDKLDCFRCKQMMISIDAESLSWLIIWRSSLEQAEGDWVRDHPDRWQEEFLPFLSLVEVVEELMQEAMYLPIWLEAEEIAGQR
ncbi:hypothetical protein HNR26_004394 [Rhizobium rosettiformans]|uniref:Uncharacterized protein n=3 Tax=Rhizobium rosettiformans TaxID=1368430 RepID=A0A7W8HUB6_9HYPH|nr:hypothetical protein [Rhizobium rosettiformans]MBB5278297.1 hypothetical protein [Rhizobium rosettiformans]